MNEELEDSLGRCREMLNDYRSKLAANLNDPPASDDDEQAQFLQPETDMAHDPLDGMRERIAMCRKLARSNTDSEVARVLSAMADEGEIDLKKPEAERRQ